MEQEKQLGTQLRIRREELGLTIDHVVQETKISSRYIQAIEAGDFGLIPGEVYLKGFIKTYSKLLNLNPSEMVSQIPSQDSSSQNANDSVEQSLYPRDKSSNQGFNVNSSMPKRSDKHSINGRSDRGPSIRKSVQIIAIVIICLLLITYVYQNIILKNLPLPEPDDQNDDPIDPGDDDTPEPEVPQVTIVEDSSGFASVNVDAEQIDLRIEANQTCWLRAQIDDNEPESQTMAPGDVLELTAVSKIQLRAGNSGGIDIYLFEELLPVSGQSGGVKNYTIQTQP